MNTIFGFDELQCINPLGQYVIADLFVYQQAVDVLRETEHQQASDFGFIQCEAFEADIGDEMVIIAALF